MPRYVEFEGAQHEFPDDITDEEIESALTGRYDVPEPDPEAPGFFERMAPRVAEIPGMMGEGFQALGRMMTGETPTPQDVYRDPMGFLQGEDPAALVRDPLEALGIFAPGLAPIYAAEELARPATERAARQYLETGTITPGMEAIDLPPEEPPLLSPEQQREFIRETGEMGAQATGYSAMALLPPWAMSRGLLRLARPALRGLDRAALASERAVAARRLAETLAERARAREAETVADAALSSQIEAQRMAGRMLPERAGPTVGPIPQPGRVGPQPALPAAPGIPQPPSPRAPIGALPEPRGAQLARALGKTPEELTPEEAYDIFRILGRPTEERIPIRPIRGAAGPTNEDLVQMAFRGAEGGEGDPLVGWLRRAPEGFREGEWVSAGPEALSPADIRTFMRLKNRNVIETRGPAGKAEYRLTENLQRTLKGEAEVPLYLKAKRERAQELAQETFGKDLEKLTSAERRAINEAIERPIKGEAPMRAAEAFVEGRPAEFRPQEIASRMQDFDVEVRPRTWLDLEDKPVWSKRVSLGEEADMFAWRDPEAGMNGVAAMSAERGLGKPLFMRTVREAGGDTDWILAGRPKEVASEATKQIIRDLTKWGMLESRASKRFPGKTEVRFGREMQRLMPLWDPVGAGKLARELDVRRPAHLDPRMRPIAGGAVDDPEYIKYVRELQDKAVDELAQAHNLDADALKRARVKPLTELAQIRDRIKADVEDVMTRATDVATGGDSPAARQGLAESINRLIQSRWEAYRARGHGRHAQEIISEMAKDKSAADEIVRTLADFDPKSRKYDQQVTRFLTGLEDDLAKVKAGKLPKRSFREMVYFAWLNARLSGPWTQVKNLVGNSSLLAARPVTRAYLGGFDMVHSALTGKARSVYATEALSDMAGVFHAIPEAARRGWHTLRTGESMFESATKLEVLRRQAQPGGPIGAIVGFPGRSLIAADEFFKILSFEGDMAAGIHRWARKTGKRIDEAPGWMQEKLHKSAIAEAERTTFTNKLPPGLRDISKARRHYGLRYVAPFFNTNMNVMLENLAHTPVLGFATAGRRAGSPVFHGAKGSLAKQATGATIAGVGAALMFYALGGNITGTGPRNPNQRRTMMASGWRPRTLKLPGLPPIDFSELSPIANILNAIGDMKDLMDEESGAIDAGDAAYRISRSILQNFTYPPFASGIQDLLDVWRDGDLEGHRARTFIQRQATTAVPVAAQQIMDVLDPVIRRPRKEAPFMGVGEAVQARGPVPGQREEVIALHDIWGREVKRPQAVLELIPGIGPTQYPVEFLDTEVLRLSKKTKPDGSPLLAIGSVVDELYDVTLSDEQYEMYQERAGELARLHNTRMVNRPRWPRLSDERQADAIKDVFERARKRAKAEVLRSDRELRQEIRRTRRETGRRLRTPKAPGKRLEFKRRENLP